MDRFGRNTSDFSPLRLHEGPKHSLTTKQREENREYNAAVAARAEMVNGFFRNAYKGTGSVSKASVKHLRRAKAGRVMNPPLHKRDQQYHVARARGASFNVALDGGM